MAQDGDRALDQEIIVRRAGRLGRLTLNRPDALNAVTHSMVLAIDEALNSWRNDPNIEAVLIDAAGERAFAAGGDVRSLYDRRPEIAPETDYHRVFWRDEYRLNATIAHYPKPFVAIMNGITMGGGVGISAHGSQRIVTDRARVAMPETAIGLIPDVGGSWLLAHAPGQIGPYLGMTGHVMNAAEAIFTGFADHYMTAQDARTFAVELEEIGARGLEGLIREYQSQPMEPGLEKRQDIIDRCFDFDSVEYILKALEKESDDWASETIAAIHKRSPLCVKLALATIRQADTLTNIEDALIQEYRCTTRLFENGEFIEGIRALIIDKDHAPQWKPFTLGHVTDELLQTYLNPLPGDRELTFNEHGTNRGDA